MHFPLSQSLLWLSLLAGVLCEPAPITPLKDDDDALPPTVFNGEQVPPFQELGSVDFEQTVKSGHWLVKFYLPGCIHCKHLAPKWQTLYEFYETLKPVPQSQSTTDKSLNSFTSFYDFHFAGVNCEAFGSLCEKYQAQAFPKVVLFKDGKIEKVFPGKRNDIPELGHSIEEALDSIKPGSRPVKGPKFPKEGDHFADAEAEPEAPVAKDKDRAAGAAAGKKHNEMASVATPTAAIADTVTVETPTATSKSTKTALKPIRPVHSTRVPNELGRSVPLTAEMFQSKVTTTRDPWFIKFYAPWCKYCQAMAPSWAELGRQMQSKLNVGEVNCDEEPRLCKDVKLKGYPTILFFQAGDRIEYDGLRGFGDLLGFAKKAVTAGQGVPDVSAAEFEKMEATEDVIFLYFYDHATATEDFIALEQVTLSLIGHARLVKTNDEALVKRFKVSTWPRLVVVRDTKATYYPALAPQDMRNTNRVVGWMKTVWLPLVPELQATNSLEIMADKLVVLGILSRERPEGFEASKRELKQAALEWMEKTAEMEIRERRELRDAKSLRIKEAEDRGDQRALRAAKSIRIDSEVGDRKRRELTFAWVDGVFWERWVRTSFGIDVRNGERVIVNDELVSNCGNPTTRSTR